MQLLRRYGSYANVMATAAVFIALGGTSYAISQPPRNSVSASQIRTDAVGRSELRSNAVRTRHINNRSVTLRDISLSTRRALQGRQGPIGPAGPPAAMLAAAVNSGGRLARSSGVETTNHSLGGSGIYEVRFNRDIGGCYALATLSDVDGGQVTQPENGEIVTRVEGRSVFVRTRNSSGAPTDLPFHVIVVC